MVCSNLCVGVCWWCCFWRACSGFVGMLDAIELWNEEAQRVLARAEHPFHSVDMHTLSVTMQSLILRDCVHFKPAVYEVQAAIHLNIIFRGTKFCF